MSASQKIALEKRIKDEFSLKNACCDKYDYMIAGTCGLIGGLIDVFFVGLPGEGKLTKCTDDIADSFVERFAKFIGWNGSGSNTTNPKASGIGFLENGGEIQ